MGKPNTASTRPKIRVLIVDDHPLVREGMASLLSKQPDFEVCGEAEDIPAALRLVDEIQPHVVTIDISLKSGSGLDLVRSIAAMEPTIRMLVCSLHDDTLYAERALQAGALGYVNKHEAPRTIVKAIRQALDGRVYLSERMSERLAQRLVGVRENNTRSSVELLSSEELEVFQMIGQGRVTSEIAAALKLGINTVDSHRRNIKVKLHLESASQLVREATQWVMESGRSN